MLTKLELSEPSSGASDVSSNKEFQRIRKRLANSASRSVRLNEREKGRLDAIAAMLAIDVNTADVLRVVRELEAI
jgi:Ribonuclease G/E